MVGLVGTGSTLNNCYNLLLVLGLQGAGILEGAGMGAMVNKKDEHIITSFAHRITGQHWKASCGSKSGSKANPGVPRRDLRLSETGKEYCCKSESGRYTRCVKINDAVFHHSIARFMKTFVRCSHQSPWKWQLFCGTEAGNRSKIS